MAQRARTGMVMAALLVGGAATFAGTLARADGPPKFVLPTPATLAEACDGKALAAFEFAPREARSGVVNELGRRLTLLAAEHHARDAAIARDRDAPVDRTVLNLLLIGFALALGGLLFARRSFAAVAIGALGILVVGYATRGLFQQWETRRSAWVAADELVQCQLRLVTAQAQIEHARTAMCLNDLGEADEDVHGWLVMMRAGTPLPLERVQKTDDEMKEEMGQ